MIGNQSWGNIETEKMNSTDIIQSNNQLTNEKNTDEKESLGGRPTKYKSEFSEQAGKLALLGFTNKDFATFFDVAVSTVDLWISKHEEFSGAIKQGREIADAEVAASLNKRARGFSYTETKSEDVINSETGRKTGEKVTTIKKHVAPDTAAAFIWLKNRQPERWRDKREVQHSGDIIPIIVDKPDWIDG